MRMITEGVAFSVAGPKSPAKRVPGDSNSHWILAGGDAVAESSAQR